MTLDMALLVREDDLTFADPEDAERVLRSRGEARDFLQSLSWCTRVEELYIGIAIGGIILVSLAHVQTSTPAADEWVWVIVGDLPPAYISIDNAQNAVGALDGYMGEMAAWADAVRTGQEVDALIPVDAPASAETAKMLESRLAFLDKELLTPLKKGDVSLPWIADGES